ncbi:zinc finger c2h2-type integrase DNA-binding protein [Stemphylium lycopersici]|uniref:Zinc finger c2h2-type integrase DNA-binding protein n=1 Tax=Stemphylium lycopersici TaxID=183478 RepID=A0A364NDV4_STELY|nr:zinc finger c2h2-type integrase DNA-binding protein [Stemphylium lycopersici]
MLDAIQSVDYYQDDDFLPGSPPLTASVVETIPSPTLPPQITTVARHRPNGHSIRTQPTQGDRALILVMDPSHPDIAQKASEQALDSDAESDQGPDSGDDDMPDAEASNTATAHSSPNHGRPIPSTTRPANQQPTLLEKLAPAPDPKATATHRDSVIEDEVIRPFGFAAADRRTSQPSAVHTAPNGVQSNINGTNRTPSISTALSNVALQPPNQLPNSLSQEHDSATSQLTIPQRGGLSADTLPALQAPSPARDAAAGSPSQQLPSFRHMDDIARSGTSYHEATRSNSISFPHRKSVSSVGQSPTSIVRALSISSHSPATPFPPLSASSPMSAHEIPHRGDLFLRTSGGGAFGTDARRPSHAASDNSPYTATLHSASTSDSYQSSDGLIPGTQPTHIEPRQRHMSLDGALASRATPPPLNSGLQQQSTPHVVGCFKCDYPGCTAAPFQTQYLLNSHTNVHSSNRPHYCPVKDCPRGEGGKGFKRKNEMIRHGLVHQSPGYVCPFCPDREHKYPRPDNLQRHVRVHHTDKDKDDSQLRDVLAQRPEGGSRGRRRRISNSGHQNINPRSIV